MRAHLRYILYMVKSLANKAMTTLAQRGCVVLDYMVEALGNDASSSLRRAILLVDIDQYPGSTQSEILTRVDINKSALTREIEWLFNYGCIMLKDDNTDGRSKQIFSCGYSQKAISSALEYCDGDHDKLKFFLHNTSKTLKQERSTLRDAKIIALLYDKNEADKQQIVNALYNGGTATDYRALSKLVDTGIVEENV